MREKLIDLLTDRIPGMDNELRYVDDERVERLADYLIANGVTVAYKLSPTEPLTNCQQWIPVTERLPEDEQKVLCILDDGFFCILEWLSWEWLWNDGHNVYAEKDITHWMPLPEPPKGE